MEVDIVEEEQEADESPQVRKSVFSDLTPTRDVLIQGRSIGKVRETTISTSLGAMGALVWKLDLLLLAPSSYEGCSYERVKVGTRLLKDDVEEISSCLDELSAVEDPPLTSICWMNEARDLSYDMEDYIDSLLFVQPEDPSLRKLSGHVKTLNSKLNIIVERLSEFRMYAQEMIGRHQRYDLHSCSTLRHRFVSLGPMFLPTQCDEETAHIIVDGRMNEFMNSLVASHVADQQQLKVVSVLGPSCLGKTTLAKVLYNRIGGQFNCRAFIRVSKKPNMKRILCDMLSQLQRLHPPQDCMEVDLIIINIKKYLQDKRYLIIIDDLWATSVWDIISHAFQKGSQGSRIIITTQIEDVALTCCCDHSTRVFEMKPLDEVHSRKLFFNRLFGCESDCPEEFKQVCYEIVAICDGLPLATISIASLLASQRVMSNDLLAYSHQSLRFCLSANSTSEKMRQVLSLNYNNLPQYLKTCLLYLSMYQEGYIFCKDDLLKQWVAEGFIDTTEGQDVEKVAESYLKQLIGRRFIQPTCINYNNEVVSCEVNDAVHDLVAHKSAQENFIVAIDYNRKNLALSHKVRRLSLLFGDARYAKTPANITRSQVRSLTFFGLCKCMPCTREFKVLRVLNLQLSGLRSDNYSHDVTGISELFQLRYLKIASDVSIALPGSMRGLQFLETLDTTSVTHFPWDIIHLPQLLHLTIPLDTTMLNWIISISGPRVSSLRSLGMLSGLQDLHVISSSSTPRSYNLERSMEVLGTLLGGHDNLKNIVLAHGPSVKNNVSCDVASEVIISWYHVAPLPLLRRFECSPHSCIIFFRIPKWFRNLDNLRILKISVTELLMNCVDTLRGLPALTALSLYVRRVPVDKIIFDKESGFSVLKYFKLSCKSGIACLKFEADAMPKLCKLKLVFNAVPPLDRPLLFRSSQVRRKVQHQRGTALISIEHMPGLREISLKFGGAAADQGFAVRTAVSNHPSNPTINVQPVDYSSYGEESTKEKEQADEYYKQPDECERKPDEILDEPPEPFSEIFQRAEDIRPPHPEKKKKFWRRQFSGSLPQVIKLLCQFSNN